MAPATASRRSTPIKFLYPRRKPNPDLSQSETYVHSQSDARKSRDHKARSSLYAAPKKYSLPGLRANQAGAISSLVFKPDDFVVMAPQRILGRLRRSHMFPFRPKRCLVSAKNCPYKENIFLSAVHQPHPHGRPRKFPLRGDNQCPLCCFIGSMGNPSHHHLEQRLSSPGSAELHGDSSLERLAI